MSKVNAIPLNNIDTSGFLLKNKYNTDKTESENKISDINGLVKKTNIIRKLLD